MRKIFRIGLLLMALFFMNGQSVVFGDYYQYTDENGNLHFTDNLAEVPEAKRQEAKSFESVNTEPSRASSNSRVSPGPPAKPAAASSTWDGQIRLTAEELDREKSQLDQIFRELQQERSELLQKTPETMKPKEREIYREKIRKLNDRIAQYEKQQAAFKEKVERFNSRILRIEDTQKRGNM